MAPRGGWAVDSLGAWAAFWPGGRIFASMVYKGIGLMSGCSLDGLDIAYVELQEQHSINRQAAKGWGYTILQTNTYPYPAEWKQRLAAAPRLSARGVRWLHTGAGRD